MLVDAIADSLADINFKSLWDKLVHQEAEEVVDTMVHRLALEVSTIRGRHCIRTRKEGTCGGGSESYYARAEEKAEGLNETLGNRLAKKNVEMPGYASSWIQAGVVLDTLIVKQV